MPKPSRVTIDTREDETWIRIRQKVFRSGAKQVLFMAFWCVWLLVWGAAGLLSIWVMVTNWPPSLFSVILLLGWAGILWLLIIAIGNQLGGREELVIQGATLWRRARKIVPYRIGSYALADLSNPRFVEEVIVHHQVGSPHNRTRPSHIAFEHKGETIKIAHALDADEAAQVLDVLRPTIGVPA